MKINEKMFKSMPDEIKELFIKLPNPSSDEVLELFPNSSVTGNRKVKDRPQQETVNTNFTRGKNAQEYTDQGSAARFFYCAKASKKDRNDGCKKLNDIEGKRTMSGGADTRGRPTPINKNHHPTVKPTELMRYLCRLVTPPNGIILDPFMGSGSTGKAAGLEGFNFIGIELDEDYFNIAQARINKS